MSMIYQDQKIAELINEIATLKAQICDLLAERTWMPIESAPKSTSIPCNGGAKVTAIYLLCYCPDMSAVDPASCICVCWWEPHLNGGEWTGEMGNKMHPTHWFMRLADILVPVASTSERETTGDANV